MKLIDKDALVAEINKRMSRICGDDFYAEVKRGLYNSLIIYLNTHEVKEVGVWKTVDNINPPQADKTDKEKKRLQEIQNVPVDEEKLRNDRRNTV